MSTSSHSVSELLTRSIDNIYPNKAELQRILETGKKLKMYVGIDPTADYVHLGHSTNYLILERFHAMGHKIIVLVGDFTAMVGDPSDKTSMRIQLTQEEILKNLKTFKEQIGKILDFNNKSNPIEFKFNSEWLAKLSFQDAVELASNFTVQQMIERDAFTKRIKGNKPLFVHEFFYPLMQGYDSVAMDVDLEIGGTDQTFNMLAGRTLLKRYKDKEKFVITTTLLENPVTGEKLMSKSLGTGIALNESPKNMFMGIMRLPDEALLQCFIDCTRLSLEEIEEIKKSLEQGSNPRDIKLRLAKEVVTMYHSKKDAENAQNLWIAEVSNKETPKDIKTVTIKGKTANTIDLVVGLIGGSNSDARRLLQQNALRLNGKTIDTESFDFNDDDIFQVGKKYFTALKSE